MNDSDFIDVIQLNDPLEDAAEYCADLLSMLGKSFILLSGGSAVEMYTHALSKPGELNNLTFGLVDERFGPYGHPNSNGQQLRDSGVTTKIEEKKAGFVGMLSPKNLELAATARDVSSTYTYIFDAHDSIVLFLGIGSDGHTAGWLPTKTKARFMQLYDVPQPIVGYEVDDEDSDNPYRQRLTLSYGFYKKLVTDPTKKVTTIVYAVGEQKHPMIKRFLEGKGAIHTYPMLGLVENGNRVVVLTDFN